MGQYSHYNYECLSCHKVTSYDETPANCKCPCGGEIDIISKFKDRISICSKGDQKEFYSIELGCSGKAQKEYKIKHPDAEFNKYGALKIKSAKHREQVLKERGMVCLSDSREYRENSKAELEQARAELK